MIVLLYGESRAAFVEPVVNRLRDSVQELGTVAHAMSIEAALREPWNCRDARRVYLCWKLGEDSVEHWHDVEAGFSGRRKLELSANSQ